MKKKIYDVIIIGGGPAGLSVGSELSKKHSVMILDKGKIGSTTKSWTSWPQNLKKNKLEDCIYNRVNRAVLRSAPGKEIEFKGIINKSYPIVNEKKVLEKWISRLEKNGATLFNNTSFKKYKRRDGSIVVETNRGIFSARFLIDASGVNSKIVKERNLIAENKYYWSVYGQRVSGVKNMPKNRYIVYETFNNEKPRVIWMYMPISKDEGFAEIFYLTKEKISLKKMKHDFEMVIKKNKKYSKNFIKAKFVEEKLGWVPIGRELKEKVPNNVAIIGDAAGWAHGLGWGFNYILLHYKKYSQRLSKLLSKNRLTQKDIVDCLQISAKEDFQKVIEDLSVALLAEAGGKASDQFFKLMNRTDPKLFEKWILLKLFNKDLFNLLVDGIQQIGIPSLLGPILKQDPSYLVEQSSRLLKDDIEQMFS